MSTPDCGVRIERRGTSMLAVIDRPRARNAISREAARALESAAHEASADMSVRALVITGAGEDVFIAGGDLRDVEANAHHALGAREVLDTGSTMHALEACEVPVIAAVQGMAIGGGCELTLACDLVILEAHATMAFREAAMGLTTGWGGGTRLIERAGPMIAARALFLGETLQAHDALAMGLAAAVVPKGRAIEEALAWVARIERFARPTITGMKRMLQSVRNERRGHGFDREAEVFASLWGQPAHRQALDSFFKRRG